MDGSPSGFFGNRSLSVAPDSYPATGVNALVRAGEPVKKPAPHFESRMLWDAVASSRSFMLHFMSNDERVDTSFNGLNFVAGRTAHGPDGL